MITLTAKIIISDGGNESLSESESTQQKNNISKTFGEIIGQKRRVKNVFLIGADKLDGTKTFSEPNDIDYFIGNVLSDQNNQFSTPYSITIKNSKPNKNKFDYFTIEFDTKNNLHPNSLYVDGIYYTVTSSIFTVSGLSGNTKHTITINDWNAPYSPLIVTGFYLGLQINVDRKNMVEIQSSIFERSDLKLPSFGIISNTGNIQFNDNNKLVKEYAENLLLEKGLACEIRITNTLVEEASKVIGVFKTNEWDYDNNSRLVSVSLKDDLEEWQDINVPEISYNPANNEPKPFSWLYSYLWSITNPNYPMKSLSKLDSATQKILKETYIKYPLLKKGTLWQQWTKLCQVCQLHIYKNSEGIVECKYKGGN